MPRAAAVVSSSDAPPNAAVSGPTAPTPATTPTPAGDANALLPPRSLAARSLAAPYASPGASPTAAATKAAGPTLPTQQSYARADILARLKSEITSRHVAWTETDLQLVPPDRIVVIGKVPQPGGAIPVQVTLRVGVTPDGQPLVTSAGVAGGPTEPVRQALADALKRRVDEANSALAGQLPTTQKLERIYVRDPDTLVVELSGGGANADEVAPTPTMRPAHPPTRGQFIIPHPIPPITHDRSSLTNGFMRADSVTPVPPERGTAALPLVTNGATPGATPIGASP